MGGDDARVSQAKTDGLVDFARVLASYGDARSGDGHLENRRRSFGPPFRKIFRKKFQDMGLPDMVSGIAHILKSIS